MKIHLLFLLLISYSLTAQDRPIEFKAEKKGNELSFFCYNNSDIMHDVTFSLPKRKGLKGYSKAIKKRVAPNSKKLFVTLTFKGGYSYKTSYNSDPILTKADIAKKTEKLKGHYADKGIDLKKGIVVFNKDGCARCHRTTSYLLDNDIDFKLIDISKEESKNNELMWTLLRENGVTVTNITTPVLLVNGKITHSHKDLLQFLKTLNP